jgi:hypothetical protein
MEFAFYNNNIFAGAKGEGVILSTDNGSNWTKVNSGLTDLNIRAITIKENNVFAGSSIGGVFLSTNNGSSWTAINNGLSNTSVKSLAVNGGNIFAGTFGGGIFLSTNDGSSWTPVSSGLTNKTVLSFAVNGGNIFAGTSGGGVFLSTNNGSSWTAINQGLGDTIVVSLIINGGYIFAGTAPDYIASKNGGIGGVWKRPLSQITSVTQPPSNFPINIILNQNYPNPFNPSTTISFSIQSKSFVTLKIFDVIGRDVATLVSEELPAGNQLRQWNAEKLSSGIYFYRLQAGTFVETKKLVLLK